MVSTLGSCVMHSALQALLCGLGAPFEAADSRYCFPSVILFSTQAVRACTAVAGPPCQCDDFLSPVSQDIIPQPLLDQFVSMTDPARAQTVDTDIAKHCAYSLPGVALTLGRQNWHCLKDTYETLASDGQVKGLVERHRQKEGGIRAGGPGAAAQLVALTLPVTVSLLLYCPLGKC